MSKLSHIFSQRSFIRPRFIATAPLLLLLVGCKGEDGAAGLSCTIEDVDDQSTLVCDDGTSTPLVAAGEPGEPGDPGDPGTDAMGCSITDNEDGTYELGCPGSDPITLVDGADGSILLESDFEPPGENCANGGHVLRVGNDTDGDGTLSESETTQTEVICQGRIIEGNVSLTSQEEVDALRGVTGVTGDLDISGEVTDLTPLQDLAFVGGHFQVWGIPADNLDGLNRLARIGEGLWLGDLEEVTSLDGLSGLQTIGGEGAIFNLDSLEDLSGLSSLTEIGEGVFLYDNDSLSSVDGLEAISGLSGNVYLYDNPALADLSALGNLTTVGGDFYIYNNGLVSLDGLQTLAEIGGGIFIQNNALLEDVSGLSSLESVGSTFGIASNNILVNVDGLMSLASIGGDLVIGPNPLLEDLSGLGGVDTVEGDISIEDNPSLPTCEAEWLADNITTIGGVTTISGNDDAGTCE